MGSKREFKRKHDGQSGWVARSCTVNNGCVIICFAWSKEVERANEAPPPLLLLPHVHIRRVCVCDDDDDDEMMSAWCLCGTRDRFAFDRVRWQYLPKTPLHSFFLPLRFFGMNFGIGEVGCWRNWVPQGLRGHFSLIVCS